MYNQPAIQIKFLTDSNGAPIFIEQGERKHYKIEVSVQNVPDDVYAVNYTLDPTYLVPFREFVNKQDDFRFDTTTYGDYILLACAMGKSRNYSTSELVSKALENAYKENANPYISEAINEIKKY